MYTVKSGVFYAVQKAEVAIRSCLKPFSNSRKYKKRDDKMKTKSYKEEHQDGAHNIYYVKFRMVL